MKSYDFDSYKDFIVKRIRAMPKQGRGELSRLATVLKTPATRLSHILRGPGNLTLEQAKELCRHFGLQELETDYLLASVLKERAGTTDLRLYYSSQMEKIRARGRELVNRVSSDKRLSEEENATFYSSWLYSAVHLATSLEDGGTIDALSARFAVPRERVRAIVEFLLKQGLCKEDQSRLSMGTSRTHLAASSPLIARHHSNWRLKAMDRHERLGPSELAFSCQVSLSREDLEEIRAELVRYIEGFYRRVEKSDPEVLAALNLDWIVV